MAEPVHAEKTVVDEATETKALDITHGESAASDHSEAPPASVLGSLSTLSVSTDTPGGKPPERPGRLQDFDRRDIRQLRRCTSNDILERYIWARDDKDALNHVPREVYFSEEISCWWSDALDDN